MRNDVDAGWVDLGGGHGIQVGVLGIQGRRLGYSGGSIQRECGKKGFPSPVFGLAPAIWETDRNLDNTLFGPTVAQPNLLDNSTTNPPTPSSPLPGLVLLVPVC